MRVLLASNASYEPPRGGSTRSNLIWLRHLAKSGHECHVVCAAAEPDDPDSLIENASGIRIQSVRNFTRRASVLSDRIRELQPDWVLVSSEDLSHVLLREAYKSAPERLVYLAHTPQWYPFGPASWHADAQASAIVRQAAGVVAISHAMDRYLHEHCGASAEVIHPPMYGEAPYPRFGSFGEGSILMVNPSIVKGLTIFLALAERFPDYPFAALAGWGTTRKDREALARLPNVEILESVPAIDDVLSRARLLLMPSLWLEGFGLIAMEAMLRGLPVIASDSGGLPEAKAGTGFVIPVHPILDFEPVFDETHMPKPVEVPQDIEPWVEALHSLLSYPELYRTESDRSREAGLAFVSQLQASSFEDYLLRLQPARTAVTPAGDPAQTLSAAKKALLLKRLRDRK